MDALLIAPLPADARQQIADGLAAVPALGEGWWDEYPGEDPAEREARVQAERRQLLALADEA